MKVKIKNVKVVPGFTINEYWESDMQVITTDKGKYIDNAVDSDYEMGHDWEEEIGGYVNVKINNSKGHKWINYKGRVQSDTYTDEEWDNIFNSNDSNPSKDDDVWGNFWGLVILIGILIAIFK